MTGAEDTSGGTCLRHVTSVISVRYIGYRCCAVGWFHCAARQTGSDSVLRRPTTHDTHNGYSGYNGYKWPTTRRTGTGTLAARASSVDGAICGCWRGCGAPPEKLERSGGASNGSRGERGDWRGGGCAEGGREAEGMATEEAPSPSCRVTRPCAGGCWGGGFAGGEERRERLESSASVAAARGLE